MDKKNINISSSQRSGREIDLALICNVYYRQQIMPENKVI